LPIGPGTRKRSKNPEAIASPFAGVPTTQACADRQFVEQLAGGCLGDGRIGLAPAIVGALLLTAIVVGRQERRASGSARTGLPSVQKKLTHFPQVSFINQGPNQG
jgi:hypothetical protein